MREFEWAPIIQSEQNKITTVYDWISEEIPLHDCSKTQQVLGLTHDMRAYLRVWRWMCDDIEQVWLREHFPYTPEVY